MIFLQNPISSLNQNLTLRFSNYYTYKQDEPDPNPHSHRGVAILIRPSIPHDPIPLQTVAVAVQVVSPTPFTLCSFYFPPKNPPTPHDLQSLISQCPAPLLLAGDANASSLSWGSDILDRRGSLIESLFLQNDLSIPHTFLCPTCHNFSH